MKQGESMKRASTILMTVFASSMVFAQATPSGSQPPSKPQAPAAAAQPATPAGKHQPMAKTQEEFAAYKAAASQQDPAAAEGAAAEFVQKYPDSELRASIYQLLMGRYQQANNGEKTVEMGRKALQYDPDNTVSLVMVATTLAERIRNTDLDKDEKIAEAIRDANHSLQTVNDLVLPPNTPLDKVQGAKNTLISMAYAAIGTTNIIQEDYAAAEQNLQKSVDLPGIEPDPLSWLRLSIALDHQKKYPEALRATNKTIDISAQQPVVQNLAKQERERLLKLTPGAAAPPTGAAPASTSPAGASTTTSPAAKPTPPPSPKN
jgi:tetratricopeptide (TPR) repeat protein